MGATIYYFSGSGNSYMLARELGKRLGKAKLVSIPDAMKKKIDTKQQVVGFVVPVYMWGIPKIVAEFLEKFPKCPDTYFFAIGNCGQSVGRTFPLMRKRLGKNGNTLHAEFKIAMPPNYTPLYGAAKESRQQRMIAQGLLALDSAGETIKARDRVEVWTHPLTFLLALGMWGPAMRKIRGFDKKFVLEHTCNGCGICAQVCPVSNIRMVKKKPVWQHACEHCLACLHWCPQEAIQFGKATRGRKRYRNPFVKLKEMVRQGKK